MSDRAGPLRHYELVGDKTGLVAGLFEVIVSALRLTGARASSFSRASGDGDTAPLWLKFLRQAEASPALLNITLLVQSIYKSNQVPVVQAPASVGSFLDVVLSTLPDSLRSYLFRKDVLCAACSTTTSVVSNKLKVPDGSPIDFSTAHAQQDVTCPACRERGHCTVTRRPVLSLYDVPSHHYSPASRGRYAPALTDIPIVLARSSSAASTRGSEAQPMLLTPAVSTNGVDALVGAMAYSADVSANQLDNYVYTLHASLQQDDPSRMFYVRAMAGAKLRQPMLGEVLYLPPVHVLRYLQGSQNSVYRRIGVLTTAFYIDLDQTDAAFGRSIVMNANRVTSLSLRAGPADPSPRRLSNRLEPVSAPLSSGGPHAFFDLEESDPRTDHPSFMAGMRPLPELRAQRFVHGRYRGLAEASGATKCLWCLVLLTFFLVVGLCICTIFVYYWLHSTLVVDRLVVRGRAAIGVDTIQTAAQLDVAIANAANPPVPLGSAGPDGPAEPAGRGAPWYTGLLRGRARAAEASKFVFYARNFTLATPVLSTEMINTNNFTNSTLTYSNVVVENITVRNNAVLQGPTTVTCNATNPTVDMAQCSLLTQTLNSGTVFFSDALVQAPGASVAEFTVAGPLRAETLTVHPGTAQFTSGTFSSNVVIQGDTVLNRDLRFAAGTASIRSQNVQWEGSGTLTMNHRDIVVNAPSTFNRELTVGAAGSVNFAAARGNITSTGLVFYGKSPADTISFDTMAVNLERQILTAESFTLRNLTSANATLANATLTASALENTTVTNATIANATMTDAYTQNLHTTVSLEAKALKVDALTVNAAGTVTLGPTVEVAHQGFKLTGLPTARTVTIDQLLVDASNYEAMLNGNVAIQNLTTANATATNMTATTVHGNAGTFASLNVSTTVNASSGNFTVLAVSGNATLGNTTFAKLLNATNLLTLGNLTAANASFGNLTTANTSASETVSFTGAFNVKNITVADNITAKTSIILSDSIVTSGDVKVLSLSGVSTNLAVTNIETDNVTTKNITTPLAFITVGQFTTINASGALNASAANFSTLATETSSNLKGATTVATLTGTTIVTTAFTATNATITNLTLPNATATSLYVLSDIKGASMTLSGNLTADDSVILAKSLVTSAKTPIITQDAAAVSFFASNVNTTVLNVTDMRANASITLPNGTTLVP